MRTERGWDVSGPAGCNVAPLCGTTRQRDLWTKTEHTRVDGELEEERHLCNEFGAWLAGLQEALDFVRWICGLAGFARAGFLFS